MAGAVVRKQALLRAASEATARGFVSRVSLSLGETLLPGFPVFFEAEADDLVLPRPPNANHAALAVLPFAMKAGLDVHVEGRTSPGLVAQLEELSFLWSVWRPDRFAPVRFSSAQEEPVRRSRSGRALAFSGGVDSCFCLESQRRAPARGEPLVAGVMVHGFDVPCEDATSFARMLSSGRRILDHYGVPLVQMRTNWRQVDVEWEMTFGIGIAAALQTLAGAFAGAGIASDLPYEDEISVWGTNSISDPLLSTPDYPIASLGRRVRRVEKIRELARVPVIREHLRVCWQPHSGGANCGVCEKCVRTRLTFAAFGVPQVPALGNRPLRVREIVSVRSPHVLKVLVMRNILESDHRLARRHALALRYQVLRESLRNRLRAAVQRRGGRRHAPRRSRLARALDSPDGPSPSG